eukprot:scaffold213028_cov18-Tisochrysis_lutea.AAC.3
MGNRMVKCLICGVDYICLLLLTECVSPSRMLAASISAASLPKKTLCTACFCDNNSSNSNRNYHNSNINKGNNKNNTSTRVAAAAVAAAGSTAIEQQQHREIKRPAQAQFSLQIN